MFPQTEDQLCVESAQVQVQVHLVLNSQVQRGCQVKSSASGCSVGGEEGVESS